MKKGVNANFFGLQRICYKIEMEREKEGEGYHEKNNPYFK
jgi:hypothetical protein